MKTLLSIAAIAILTISACSSTQEKKIMGQVVEPCIEKCAKVEAYEACMKDCLKANSEILIIDEVIEELTESD